MYVEIRPYNRDHPQRIADLSALIKYMLEAKDPRTENEKNHEQRLAGPPVTARLVQRVSPFGNTINAASYDLAQQLFNHARDRQVAEDLPPEVYKYLFISFPIHQPINKKFLALTPMTAERQDVSDFQNMIRVVRELLDAMGIGENTPSIIVVHDDTDHYHAHVVVGLFAADIDCTTAFNELSYARIKEIASALYAGNRWRFPSKALANEPNESLRPGDPGFRPGL